MKDMKKYKYIGVLGLCLAAGFTSCSLDEEPDSYYAQNNFFTNEDNAKLSVIGVYDNFASMKHYGQYEMAMPCSDDTYFINGTNTDNTRRDIAHYTLTTTNQWVTPLWQYKYQGIDRANFAIAGIEGMAGYEENAKLQNYVAQAKFLRAFLAFDLIKYWGDVPFKTTYTSSFESAFGPRVSREVIYDQIIEDLKFAKNKLSAPSASINPETPSQAAARALLMRVYLQRAGYSLQQDGTLTRPDDAKRAEYFKAVIDEWDVLKANGYNDLYPETEGDNGYLALFKNFSAGKYDSKESLWEIAFNPSGANFSEDCGMWGTYNGPEVAMPDANADKTKVMGRANAFFRVVPTWKDFFEDNDARRDVMVVTYSYKWKDGAHVKAENKPEKWFPGKWRREWMPLGFVDPNNTDVNFCPLRFADAILMAAEAYNETGNSAEAWSLISRVRQRAGATPVTAANYADFYKAPKVYDLPFMDDANEQGKVRTALYWERGFELAFEGQRKYDLIRWGVMDKALKLFKNNLPADALYDKVRKGYIAAEKFTPGKHELFPIPLDEIQANAKLEGKNNPGY